MMHVDKNANGHVLDQNVDWILREIAYVPLSGRIRSKRSSCMQPSFFWEKKMSTRHAYQWSNGFVVLDMLPRGPMNWNLDVFPRGPMVWSLDVLPRDLMELDLDVLPKGPLKLNSGRASQRSNGLKFGRASQRTDGIGFGHASQRSIEIEFWTCFPEVRWFGRYYSYRCVWAFYPNTCKINTFN